MPRVRAGVGERGPRARAHAQDRETRDLPGLMQGLEVVGGRGGAVVQFLSLELIGTGLGGVAQVAPDLRVGRVGPFRGEPVQGATRIEANATYGGSGLADVVQKPRR